MRDHEAGAPLHDLLHALLDERFGQRIDRRGRLVHDEDFRSGQHGPRIESTGTAPARRRPAARVSGPGYRDLDPRAAGTTPGQPCPGVGKPTTPAADKRRQ